MHTHTYKQSGMRTLTLADLPLGRRGICLRPRIIKEPRELGIIRENTSNLFFSPLEAPPYSARGVTHVSDAVWPSKSMTCHTLLTKQHQIHGLHTVRLRELFCSLGCFSGEIVSATCESKESW